MAHLSWKAREPQRRNDGDSLPIMGTSALKHSEKLCVLKVLLLAPNQS